MLVLRSKHGGYKIRKVAIPSWIPELGNSPSLIQSQWQAVPIANHAIANEPRGASRFILNARHGMLDPRINGPALQSLRKPHERLGRAGLAEQRQNVSLIPEHGSRLIHDAASGFSDDVLHPLAGEREFNTGKLDPIRRARGSHDRHLHRRG